MEKKIKSLLGNCPSSFWTDGTTGIGKMNAGVRIGDDDTSRDNNTAKVHYHNNKEAGKVK